MIRQWCNLSLSCMCCLPLQPVLKLPTAFTIATCCRALEQQLHAAVAADPCASQALASEGLAEALARACLLGTARAVAAALLPGEAGKAAGEQAVALLARLLEQHGSQHRCVGCSSMGWWQADAQCAHGCVALQVMWHQEGCKRVPGHDAMQGACSAAQPGS